MASWIVQFPLTTDLFSQLLLFRRWPLMLFNHYCCHRCVCCIWPPVLCTYRQICFCNSESWLLLCLPFCCLAVTATFSAASLFLILAQFPALEVDKKRPPKKLLLVPNFAMAEELSLSQITKLLAHRARKWVFAPIIANLSFRWRFVLHQLHQCLFSTCHSSPTRKKCSFCLCWEWLQGHLECTEACNSKKTGTNCSKQSWLRLYLQEPEQSALVIMKFFQSIYGVLETSSIPLRVVWLAVGVLFQQPKKQERIQL